ncbi:MAG TPA: transcriptional regulator [Mariniphaga anaerophila]|uniref:Transcriptional regulator n=1 Tax=Mariniphaga anaerophila TaxID=1484053 RepID=A0A831LPF5_9BACT|nr:transcriptional regulator [Mariniphaga anaerophila]
MKNKVKLHRVMRDKTQEELANSIGVSRQTIHAIERNKFVPSVQTALKLADYFNVKVEELFQLEEKQGK